MRGLVVDTSALICILFDEPGALKFAQALADEDRCAISTASVLEGHSVMIRRRIPDGAERFAGLVADLRLEVAAFDARQLETAIAAYRYYGRGTGHDADLNLGDCFSYALARTRNMPLLFKGDDFVHTDIASALPAG